MRLRSARVVPLSTACLLSLLAYPGAHAADCSLQQLAGEWAYAEQGTQITPVVAPFAEVGWFKLDKNGTGAGEAFINIGGTPIPPEGALAGLPLQLTRVQIHPSTCIGTGTFIVAGDTAHPRGITFSIFSRQELHYLSTTGDSTVSGVAMKR